MYSLQIKKTALKELAGVPAPFQQKIVQVIDSLAENPRPIGCKQLKGEKAYRVRVADYRIVYTVEDVIRIVAVQRIGHRKDIYR